MSRILGAVQLIRMLITETCNLMTLLWVRYGDDATFKN